MFDWNCACSVSLANCGWPWRSEHSMTAAVIQGSDEAARGVVVLKDLILGAKIAENATLEEWKDRPAQVEIPRGDIVAAIRKMLAQ